MLLLSIFLFCLLINESLKNARYTTSIEELKRSGIFRSEAIRVNENNRYYRYVKSSNENIYSYYIYKLNADNTIGNISMEEFSGDLIIDFSDYPGVKQIYGCIILKLNIS